MKVSCKHTIRHSIADHALMQISIEGDRPPVEKKFERAIRRLTIVTSTSATIPMANMRDVTPSMHILVGEEVKPGLLLKAISCQRIVFPFMKTQLTG
jgi:hypothetical protein